MAEATGRKRKKKKKAESPLPAWIGRLPQHHWDSFQSGKISDEFVTLNHSRENGVEGSLARSMSVSANQLAS